MSRSFRMIIFASTLAPACWPVHAQEASAGEKALFCQLKNTQTKQAYFSGVSKHENLTKFRVSTYAGRFQLTVNQAFREHFERQPWTCQAYATQLKAASKQATARSWLESQGYQIKVVGTF